MTTAQTTQPLEATTEIITSFPNYGLVWLLYIGLTFLMVGIIWWTFKRFHFVVKWLFASIVLAGALTPGHPAENTETYSPLVLTAVVDLFDDNKTGFYSTLKTIGISWVILFFLGLALWFAFKHFKKSPTKKNNKKASSPVEPKVS